MPTKRITDLAAEWTRAKEGALEFIDAIPDNLLGFYPVPEVFNFALQYIHIAGANYLFASGVFGIENPFDRSKGNEPEKNEDLQRDKAALKAFVGGSYDFVIGGLMSVDPATLEDDVQFHKWTMSRASMISKALEHHAHHRGQTAVYFRINGLKPPAEHLF